MKMRLKLASLLVATILSGCASNPRIDQLTSSQRADVGKVQIYKGEPSADYRVISEVSGLSCNRNAYQQLDTSEDEALEGVKIKAVLLGANSVINTLCQKSSDTDWANNCWASVKCIGDAAVVSSGQ